MSNEHGHTAASLQEFAIQEVSAGGPLAPEYRSTLGRVHPLIWRSRRNGVDVCAAMVAHLSHGGKAHSVVVACYRGEYYFWCGDRSLEDKPDYEVEQWEWLQVAKDLVTPEAYTELAGQVGQHQESDGCHFWSQKAKGTCCKHVRQVFMNLLDSSAGMQKHLSDLALKEQEYRGLTERVSEVGTVDLMLAKCCGPAAPAPMPVLLEGDPGVGKTHAARALGRDGGFDLVVEVSGHEGMEARDFIGGPMPLGNGFAWQDGPVGQAFRAASSGQQVLLIIDELYRVPRRGRSIFLTALSPTYDGYYQLSTDRPLSVDGQLATAEVLRAPVARLSIIATTNVGSDFAIEDDDPAMAERWLTLRMQSSDDALQSVLRSRLEARGLSVEDNVERLIRFRTKMLALRKDFLVSGVPSLRLLLRAIDLSESDGDLPHRLRVVGLKWVEHQADGSPNDEQIQLIHRVIDSIWR